MMHIGDQTVNDEPQAPFGGVNVSGQAALDQRPMNITNIPIKQCRLPYWGQFICGCIELWSRC
jgi:hypothetical protein